MSRKQETLTAYLFLLPILIIFITLIAAPVVVSLLLSFTKWNFLSGIQNIQIVGIQNFVNLFKDRYFVQAIKNTVIYTVTTVPISLLLALAIAYLLNGKTYIKKSLRLCFFIPYISSAVALAAVFKAVLRDDGVVNQILHYVFQVSDLPKWFADSSLNKIPIILLVIWTAIGYELIIYMAALQNIPASLYEASEIDGASGFAKFIHITFPMISPTTFFLVIVRMIATFKIFTSVNVMTLGAPTKANTSMVMRIYQEAFSNYKFGFASAEALFLFFIILTVTLIQFAGQKKWVHY